MEVAVPLVHVLDLDGDLARDGKLFLWPVRDLVAFQRLVDVTAGGGLGRLDRGRGSRRCLCRALVFLAHGLPHGGRCLLGGRFLAWFLCHGLRPHLLWPVWRRFSMKIE